MVVDRVRTEMKRQASPTKAKLLQRFFKTGMGEYGEGDVFLGLVVPQIRALVKKYWQQLSLAEVKILLRSKFHEERLLALLVLVAKFIHAGATERQKIYAFYLRHAKRVNNWDLVDLSAPNIVGRYLLDKPHAVLYKLVRSKNIWERRIAVLASFAFIRAGELSDSLRLCRLLLADQHDLIHKATGWMLREVGKRDADVLKKFLKQNYARLPRTTLRYAIERFPAHVRQRYLAGRM